MLTVTTLEDRCNLVETTLVEQLVEAAASLYRFVQNSRRDRCSLDCPFPRSFVQPRWRFRCNLVEPASFNRHVGWTTWWLTLITGPLQFLINLLFRVRCWLTFGLASLMSYRKYLSCDPPSPEKTHQCMNNKIVEECIFHVFLHVCTIVENAGKMPKITKNDEDTIFVNFSKMSKDVEKCRDTCFG